MNEASLRQEISRMLAHYGFEHYHPVDARKTKEARPDIYSMNPSGSFVIEVKMIQEKTRVETWFHPKIISNGQRKWLDRWFIRDGHGYLAIGTTGGKRRRLWVMPWGIWIGFEKSLVKSTDPSELKEMRVTLSQLEFFFGDDECTWVTLKDKSYPNSNWRLPEGHSILEDFNGRPMQLSDWTALSLRFDEEE